MKNIVFITRHDPTKVGGGAFATRAYLEALNKLYPNQVVLFVADSYQDGILMGESSKIIKLPPRPKLKAILGLIIGDLTRFKLAVSFWLKNNNTKVDTVVFDGSIIGGTFITIFKKLDCKIITIHHNFEVDYHRDNKSIESIRGKFLYWVRKFEKKSYLNSNINLFLTKPDILLFNQAYGKSNAANNVIGCFEYPNKNKVKAESKKVEKLNVSTNIKLVISGSLVTYQTLDGVLWFLKSIYPKIIKKYPNIVLIITGRSPNKELVTLCEKMNVKLVPSPKNIKKIIAQGNIYICPTRLGGGLKLRIMDPLALGLPCLIQDKSYRGYEEIGKLKYVDSFTDENDFMSKLDNLIFELKNTKTYSKEIREAYKNVFSFESGVQRFINFLK